MLLGYLLSASFSQAMCTIQSDKAEVKQMYGVLQQIDPSTMP
jgi:hypothetical protein